MTKNLLPSLLNGIGVYLALTLFVHFFANNLIYFPPPPGYSDGHDIIKLKTRDGKIVSALYLPNPAAHYTILVSHGNAEDLGYMKPFLYQMQQRGFAVFAYDYHGYGTSTGSPNEKRCYADIDAAYLYVTQKLGIPAQQIVLYGRSLGSAVALDLAVRRPVGALIMEAPFMSAYRIVTRLPLIAFDQFNNRAKIKKLTVPLLIIHGERDTVVPIWHSKKLYAVAPAPKHYFQVAHADHNDILWTAKENYWQTIANFVKTVLP